MVRLGKGVVNGSKLICCKLPAYTAAVLLNSIRVSGLRNCEDIWVTRQKIKCDLSRSAAMSLGNLR